MSKNLYQPTSHPAQYSKNYKGAHSVFKFVLLFLISAMSVVQTQAEGTKQLRPSSGDAGYVVLDNSWSDFALYGCAKTSRLHIRIKSTTEKVFLGFNQGNGDVKFRIRDKNDVIVFAQTNVPTSGNGYISSYNRAVNGPSTIVGSGGYTPITFSPGSTGDFYIEFSNQGSRRDFEYFDITVATSANVAIPGRVWCQAWMISTRSYENVFKGKFFMYADDGIVTSLDFNGTQPFVYVISANKTGTQDSNDFQVDRRSRTGNVTYPQYKIFLNDPDSDQFPSGTFGEIDNTQTSITGCGTNKCINITVNKPGDVFVTLNLNGTPGYQPGTTDVQLSATVVPGANCIPWDGKNGNGVMIPGGTNVNMIIDYLNGLTHMPLYDVEYNLNGFKVQQIHPVGTAPKLFFDDAVNIPGGVTNLTGCNSPCHTWNWNAEQKDISATDYGNRNTINTWWYSNISPATATVPVFDVVVDANRLNSPLAANDTTVCSNTAAIPLHGIVSGSVTTGVWSGAGTFSPTANNVNSSYVPTAGEMSAGRAKLTLTSSSAVGGCGVAFDTLIINILPGPTVNAGPVQSKCTNNPVLTLAGSKTIASRAKWTGGAGSYIPNDTTLNATYTPSAGEITAKTVTLTLTTTVGNGICPAAAGSVTFTFFDPPTIDAGNTVTSCANNPVVTLAGSSSGHTSRSWSGGAGTFSNVNSPTSTYTPTPAEITAGTVTLTFSATKAGCFNVSDNTTVTINPSPTASAGNNKTVCSNNAVVSLTGTTGGGATGQSWSGGTGTFSAPNSATTNYTPSTAERNAAPTSVVLTFAASKTGCTNVTSTVTVNITKAPTVAASSLLLSCGNKANVTLDGSTTSPAGATWTSDGTGTFVPNNTTLNATYIPSADDIAVLSVLLTLTTNPDGSCSPVSTNTQLQISATPTSEAGSPISVCKNNPTANLTGTIGFGTALWSGGNGTFGSTTNPVTTYTPTAGELSAGSVTLILTVSDPACNAVTDQITITYTNSPVLDAGNTQSVCANNSVVTLNGTSSTTAGSWTGGSGTFSNSNSLTSTYTPSAAERNAAPTSVVLTLTSGNNVNCTAVTDQMTINITASPTVSAGANKSVCSNNSTTSFTGTSSTGAGVWSGGTGTFTTPNALTSTYTPSAAEISAAPTNVTLTFTSGTNGNCNSVNSTATLSITAPPTINAGTDKSACANNPNVTLSGTSNGIVTAVLWSGGGGTFTPDNTTKNAVYTPTAAEISAEGVTLTLTSTAQGTCNPVSATTNITYTKAPSPYAGADQVVCGNVTNITLTPTLTDATGRSWSTDGTGSFTPNSTSPSAKYVPSNADKTAGIVTLTLTGTKNGCNSVEDEMTIEFETAPSIDAGPPQTVCTHDAPVQLDGFGSPATWSGGAGSFSSTTDLRAIYTPSAGELSAAPTNIVFTLTTIASGSCPSVNDQVTITINPAPVPNTGGNQTVCGNGSTVSLAGATESNATSRTWTTNGTGHFSASSTILNPTYTPSAQDITAGTVTLTLTSVSGTCSGVSSDAVITITPTHSVVAGGDQIICSNISTAQLNAVATNTTNFSWAVISGAGSLSSNTILNPFYTRVPADTVAGSVTVRISSPANGACPASQDDIIISFSPSPSVEAGTTDNVCANVSSVTLNGSVNAVVTEAKWTSNGTGIFSPNAFALNAQYFPSAADTLAGNITLTLSSTLMGTCNAVSDTKQIIFSKTHRAFAGNDQTVCSGTASVNISGTRNNATASTWTTSGTGTFGDATSLTTTYAPSAADYADETVTLTLSTMAGACSSVNDKVIIFFDPIPVVSAGLNKSVCANNANVSLLGSLETATAAQWSGGTGSFSSTTTLGTVYTPSAAEIAAAPTTVTLTLTSTAGNGTCAAQSGTIDISITVAPTANAGMPAIICADSAFVNLAGISSTGAGKWTTTGSGVFFPNNFALNAQYVPSAADKASGNIVLTLATEANGSCNAVTSTRALTITPAPTVFAGNDQTICASTNSINLNGTVTVATGVKWATSGSGTFGDNTLQATTYTFSADDKASGLVVLTLKTTAGTGTCDTAYHSMMIHITPEPIVDAGSPATICGNTLSYTLQGTFNHAPSVTWSTGGSGVFDNTSDALTKYYPSEADKAAGTVTLTLTTASGQTCSPKNDQVTITITGVPVVDAGDNLQICGDSAGVELSGSVSGITTTGKWTTSGSGSFLPSATTLNAVYQPSVADISAGTATLTLTSQNNGPCVAATGQITLTIDPIPTIVAGSSQTVCEDVEMVFVNATVTGGATVSWSTAGTGTFSNELTSSANYSPSADDVTAGKITLTGTTVSTNGCHAYTSQLDVFFTPMPTVELGSNLTVCTGITSIALTANITEATGGLWITDGAGTFSPDESTLTASYLPDPSENVNGNSVKIYLNTTGNGSCEAARDSITITFNTAAVSAGSNTTVCTNSYPLQLSGTGSGTWSSDGDGSFSDINSLNSTYTPGAGDEGTGSVNLTLTAPAVGSCIAAVSTITVNIITGPSISAGASTTVCTNAASVNVTGTINVATQGLWTTAGTGTFDNANSGSPNYTPSNADKNAGSVVLRYRSVDHGICKAVRDTMTIFFEKLPVIDAGQPQTICRDVPTVQLTGTSQNTTAVVWSKVTGMGLGTFSSASSLTPTYTADASELTGSVTVRLSSNNGGSSVCPVVSDDVIITYTTAPTVTQGSDIVVCKDTTSIQLNGSVTIAGGGLWTTDGNGTFSPNANTLNAKYIPTANDKTDGSVILTLTTTDNGSCNSRNGSLTVTFNDQPTITLPVTTMTRCSDISAISLNGTTDHSAAALWTTTGTGTFADATDPNTTYTPSALDKANGGVNLKLVTSGNAPCKEVSGFINIILTPAPSAVVNAGQDQSLCIDITQTQLLGDVQIASGGNWSVMGGSTGGSFFPNDSTLEATYIPSATDKSNGSVTLVLTSTGNGICSPVSDDMTLDFTDAPTVDAGGNRSVCATKDSLELVGNVTVATQGSWTSSGTGIFVVNEFTLTPSYFPSDEDKSTGQVGLTLVTTDNGTCNARTANVTITFTPSPTAFAGNDISICSDAVSIPINGSVTIATGGLWTSSGSGTFTDDEDLTTNYLPSAADISATHVILTLKTTNMGTCDTIASKVDINFTPAPTINASPDLSVCADVTSVSLTGSITISTGGVWTSTGTGSFTPGSTTLNAAYKPSSADKTAGSVNLTLTTTGNGTCQPINKMMTLTFDPIPEVSAGNGALCSATADGVALSGTVDHAVGGKWTTTGTGNFAPNAFDLNAAYHPSPADIASGKVTVTLTSTGNASCNPVTSSINLFFGALPIANAGNDQYICRNTSTIVNAQTVSNVSYVWSTTTGISLSTVHTANVTANTDTAYVVSVTDSRGCINRDTIDVFVVDDPGFTLPAHHCYDYYLVVHPNPSAAMSNATYQWYYEDELLQDENDSTLRISQPGTYEVTYTVGSCKIYSAQTEITRPPRIVTPDSLIACEGDDANLSTTLIATATYTWSTGTNGVGLNTSTVTPVMVGNNYYFVTVTDAVGCSTEDSTLVEGITKPVIELADSTGCQGADITLDATPTNMSLAGFDPTFAWKRNGSNLSSTQSSIVASQTGEYTVILTIDQCISKDTADILLNERPTISMSEVEKRCFDVSNPPTVTLNAGNSNAGNTILWFSDANPSLGTTQTITVNEVGEYFVTVTNSFNCSRTDSVLVKNVCEPNLFIPTGFTPGCGTNCPDAQFEIHSRHVYKFNMMVFNRWGEIIFETNDISVFWDGNYRGEPMPTGVYPWIITYEGDQEEFPGTQKLEGKITIIR